MSGEIQAIQNAWAEHVEMEQKRPPAEPHNYIWASSRRKCRRRMFLECTQPADFPPFDTEAKARFARGTNRERDISIDLQRVGRLCIPRFDFVGQQDRVIINDRKGRKIISGKRDGFLKWESNATWSVELKSWSPFITDKLFTFADIIAGKYTWSGAFQLLSYMYRYDEPYGVFVLDRPGLPRLVQVSLEENVQAMEEFLLDAEAVVDAIEKGQPPDFIKNPDECNRCSAMGHLCNPPIAYDGAKIFTDEETIAKTERFAEIQAMPEIEEFADLEKYVKERFRGVTQAIVGKCLVTGRWQKDTKKDLPAEVKAQIKELEAPYKKQVLEGKFFLDITQV